MPPTPKEIYKKAILGTKSESVAISYGCRQRKHKGKKNYEAF
jgi:hypothetical protein